MNGETQLAFGIGLIDVIIGLAFIFFSLSVIASYLLESFYSVTRERARFLQKAVAQLVDERVNGQVHIGELTKEIFAHPLIAKKSARIDSGGRFKIAAWGPAYIQPQDFTDVLLAILRERYPHQPSMLGYGEMVRQLPPEETIKSVLAPLLNKSDSISEFRQNIAIWYDDAMERASGSFKRQTQLPLLIIGTVLALSMDVSTIEYANRLANDGALRSALVAEATSQVANIQSDAPDVTKEYLADLSKSIQTFNNDLADFGSNVAVRDLNNNMADILERLSTQKVEKDNKEAPGSKKEGNTLFWVIGCLFTGVAVSLGTSFWLNFLKLMISVRSSIRPGDSNPKDAPAAGAAANQPSPSPSLEGGSSSGSFEDHLDTKKISEIQEILGLSGDEVTGIMSMATRAALDKWRDDFGLPLGGLLTLEEYMLLKNPERWKR
ncbi:hypothetical protein SG34_006950 [Thalassomonas viridans]|uniref:Uncharacterized protein n=1 Tax=Thalassomonas viridans TaxID=137584 RepID=A0AAE9Z7C7_9GAMM|nr:hypothetical protein [Thalassomonas viridans]WDE06638.1 hypothetical protein SG34_006950 [Thalassomonas viridans]